MMLSIHNHESAKKAFPSGGNGPWPDIANYLSGPGGSPLGPDKQGLGWAFQILPYLEGQATYNIKTTLQMEQTIIPMYNCPSRRPATKNPTTNCYLLDYAAAVPYRSKGQLGTRQADYPYTRPDTTGKYRNQGCASTNEFWNGVQHESTGSMQNRPATSPLAYHGVIVRSGWCGTCTGNKDMGFYSRISFNHITDGSSNTMVIGEKWVNASTYDIGAWNDDKGWTDGWDPDALRVNLCGLVPDSVPSSTDPTDAMDLGFGSSHPAGIVTGYADASVRMLNYDIDLEIFNRLGNRDDDELVELGAL